MSQTAGVKPMTIAGRVAHERERCLGMTDAERAWRKQWLKDQILAPNEPVHVPEYVRERTNPIRRLYRAPLDTIFNKLSPTLGLERAQDFRYITGKLILIGFGAMCVHYYFKYNRNDWTRKGGWRVHYTKPTVYPDSPDYPFKNPRTSDGDYANRGFKNAPI